MLLRRITEHVKAQNWTAVALDFVIVVVGVFIGIQVANWNGDRLAQSRENAILAQLEEEFLEIQTAIDSQIGFRRQYIESLGALIEVLESKDDVADEAIVKVGLENATTTGRWPPQSSAYLQLMANGELATLSSEKLQKLLVRYDARRERDAHLIPELLRLVIAELSLNAGTDRAITINPNMGAAIDENVPADYHPGDLIRSFNLEQLRQYEQRYEAMYILHGTLELAEIRQLEIVKQILELLTTETNL